MKDTTMTSTTTPETTESPDPSVALMSTSSLSPSAVQLGVRRETHTVNESLHRSGAWQP